MIFYKSEKFDGKFPTQNTKLLTLLVFEQAVQNYIFVPSCRISFTYNFFWNIISLPYTGKKRVFKSLQSQYFWIRNQFAYLIKKSGSFLLLKCILNERTWFHFEKPCSIFNCLKSYYINFFSSIKTWIATQKNNFKLWFLSLFYNHFCSWTYAFDTALAPLFWIVDNYSGKLGQVNSLINDDCNFVV